MIQYSTALRNALMTSLADGGNPFAEIMAGATLRIYSGAQPDDPDSAMTGTMLLEITGLTWTDADAGSISKPAEATWSAAVLADGAPQSFRLTAPTGESLDGSLGLGEDMQFLNYAWTVGQTKTIDSMTVTMPAFVAAQSGGGGDGQIIGPDDETIGVTVGPGGDFALLSEAINYLSEYRPYGVQNTSGAGKIYGKITILSGFTMIEPLVFGSGTDLAWIHINGRYSDTYDFEKIAFDADNMGANLTVIRVDQGSRAPQFNNCVFEQTAGASQAWAFKVYDGSDLSLYRSGAIGCKGLYATYSRVVLHNCSFLGCGSETLTLMQGAHVDVWASSITDSLGGPAVWLDQGSLATLHNCDLTGAEAPTIYCEGGRVVLSGTTDCRQNGTTEGSGDIVVANGGIVQVGENVLGGYSQAANITTEDGLIIAPGDPGNTIAWGGISGTLSDQTDLQSALDGKAAAGDLHTHANKSTLDKIGELGGDPTWNGEAWPDGGGLTIAQARQLAIIYG